MRLRSPLLLLAAGLVLAGCVHAARPGHGVRAVHQVRCSVGSFFRLGSRRLAYAAIVRSRAQIFRRPDGQVFVRFGRLNYNKVPVVFGVIGARVNTRCAPLWYRIRLPVRPNGVTGWVPASQVSIATLKTRIDVDVTTRRLTLFVSGRPVISSPVAVGAPATPTPVGSYYVNQRLIPTDPKGPYGPGAVGVSAFSNVLTGWTQGGPIGIHGTNEPWSIGHYGSNGCIRLPNATLRRVFRLALPGTPVVIHP